jgi:hypothetical protein
MIEINDKGLFQDYCTGLKYHEITKEMIEGCLDDEIDNAYEGWSFTKDEVYPASRCLKVLNSGLYSQMVLDYMERNNIIPLDCEEGVRYFELDEDANDVR